MENLGVSLKQRRRDQSFSQETLKVPRVTTYRWLGGESLEVLQVGTLEALITPQQFYLADGFLHAEPTKAKTVKRNVKKYTLIDGKLFCHGYTHAILTGVSRDQCTRIMEELHEGICRSHDGGRALSLKVIRVGYYWPTMKEDCMKYAQRCE